MAMTDADDQRPRQRRPLPDAEVWEDPPMRQALAACHTAAAPPQPSDQLESP